MLNNRIFAIEQHDKHSHGLDILFREVCVLKLDKVVLVVHLEAAPLAPIQQFFPGLLLL